MAENKVTIKTILDDEGTTKRTTKSAEKASKALDKTGKSAQSADRALKGTAGVSSNVTKNFSKMSQGITGGLVPAYATLAANVFAISAAFQFLQRAADVTNLIEGQKALGAITGVAFRSISESVKEATAGQLTYQEAARGTAIGVAAGLSATQLNQLGEAANNASLALGRDLTDSFNRLVRGVTKAEPELLDELGIILRLDDATRKYADALGISQSSLTTYQKQQAVANEVLTQAEEKFGKISEIVDGSGQSLNRFLASFDSLANSLQTFLTSTLAPVFDFLSNSTASLVASLTFLASGITKALFNVGGFEKLGVAAEVAEGNIRQLANSSGKIGKSIAEGGQIGRRELAALEKATKAQNTTVLNGSRAQRKALQTDLAIYRAQFELTMAQNQKGFKRFTATVIANLRLMQAELGKTRGFIAFLGKGFLNLLPIVGTLVIVVDLFSEWVKSILPVNEALERGKKELEEYGNSLRRVREEIESQQALTRAAGLSLVELTKQTANAIVSADLFNNAIKLQAAEPAIKQTEDYSNKVLELAKNFRTIAKADPQFGQFADELERQGSLSESSLDKLSALQESYAGVGAAIESLPKGNEAIQTSLKAVAGASEDALDTLVKNLKTSVKDGASAVAGAANQLQILQEQRVEALVNEIGINQRLAAARKEVEAIGQFVQGPAAEQARERLALVEEEARQLRDRKKAADEAVLSGFASLDAQRKAQDERVANEAKFRDLLDQSNASRNKARELEESVARAKTAGLTIDDKISNIEASRVSLGISIAKAEERVARAKAANEAATGNAQVLTERALQDAETALVVAQENARVKREQLNNQKALLMLEKEGLALAVQEKEIEADKIAQKTLDFKKQELDIQQKILDSEQQIARSRLKILENETKLRAFRERGTLELNAKEQLELDLKTAQQTFEFAVQEAELKKQQIDAETELQKQKLDILKLENDLVIAQTKLEIQRAASQGLDTSGLQSVVAALEGVDVESAIERQKSSLDTLAKTRKSAIDASVQEATSNLQLSIIGAFQGAFANDEIYQTFREGLKTNLEAFFKGEKTFGQAIGDTIVSVLEKKASLLLDQAFDLAENTVLITATNANTVAIQTLTAALTGVSFTGGVGTETGGGGILSGIAGFFTSLFGKAPSAAALDAGAAGTAGALGIPEAGTLAVAAKGAIMQGGFQAFADGGIVKRPTFGLVGEGGMNEAVVPLPDGKAIPVNMNGTNNNNNVAVNINMATGQAETTGNSEQLASFGNSIVDIVQREIADQTRPGGLLAR